MLITPSEDSFHDALATIDQGDKGRIEAAFPARVDVSKAVIDIPRSDVSRQSLADVYRINWSGFFGQTASADNRSTTVVVSRVETQARLLAETGNAKEYFKITIEWSLSGGAQSFVAKGGAVGSRYKSHGDRTKNPEAIRSANIAFYAAFLKAMSQIAAQVQSEAPPSSAVPNEPPTKKKEGDANGLFGR